MDLLDNSKDALDMSRSFPVLWRREGDSWRPLGLKANWWSGGDPGGWKETGGDLGDWKLG